MPIRFLPVLCAALLATVSTSPRLQAQNTTANEGGDVAFGGPGSEPGKFQVLNDITFDPNGVLYVLEGVRMDNKSKALVGNLRVQRFDRTGKVLGSIDLKTAPGMEWSDKVQPARVATDGAGNVYVTAPGAGKVLLWSAVGAFLRAIDIPGAMAVTRVGTGGQERIAVVPSQRVQNKWQGGDKIVLLTAAGVIEKTITLPQSFGEVQDLAADAAGRFYLKAEPNAVYQLSPEGVVLKTFGGNVTTRNSDGSELLHTVAVDSKGNVYSFSWGNPSLLTRFDADGKTVTQRGGQWKWADPWGAHSHYTPLAIDPDDRVWVAATATHDAANPNFKAYRAVPALVRTRADFFSVPANAVIQTPMRKLGFKPEVKSGLPSNVSFEPGKPVSMEFSIAAANRNVTATTATWRVFDAVKSEVGNGTFDLPLVNGQAATAAFNWTPPRFGSYFVQVQMTSPEGELGALGEHVGVTPQFANMLSDVSGFKGGWDDSARQMWSGLPNMRIHPGFRKEDKPEERAKKMDALEARIASIEKSGATFLLQVVDSQKNFNADDVRAIMERFKGRVKHVEVCNEPNFSGSIEDYFKIHKATYDIVKAVDPTAKVMGPATVNIDLGWLKRLYTLGFKDVTDIVSVHDYEGHESIDPAHWAWKFGEVRKIMAANGDAEKPIWQTERALSGVRGNNFQGLVQAIRMGLHRDLLETLGIPSEHNNHYYLNQGGYSSVPTYVWSAQGPHPGALLTRTRHALTRALGRTYAGTLDFGPTGNTLYFGVRYKGAEGETNVLRNLGAPTSKLDFGVKGGGVLNVTDTWGNKSTVQTKDGKVSLEVSQLPIYVEPSSGQTLEPPRMDFGRNFAPRVEFVYSSTNKGAMSLLNNGIIETYNAGNPNGDTNGAKIWQGELPTPGQHLEMRFARPTPVHQIIVRTPRPDNTFTTLLDYDIQARVGADWSTIGEVRRRMPASEPAVTADAVNTIWTDDTNVFTHTFPTVTTDRLRLVARETTRGFLPDDLVRAWSNQIPQKLMLREVEIYAPTVPVEVEAVLQGEGTTRTLLATVSNRGPKAVTGSLQAFAPTGWKVPGSSPVTIAAGASKAVPVAIQLPAVITAGTNFVDVELRDDQNALLDTHFASLQTVAPVELTPQATNAAAASVEGAVVRLALKNTSATPISGQAVVRLTGPTEKQPLEQAFGPIAPGGSAAVEWRAPGVNLATERWSAAFDVTAGGVRSSAHKDLFGQSWSAVGPFPRGFDVAEGPEKTMTFDPNANYTDMVGTSRKWQVLDPNADGMVNLADAIKPNNDVQAYAVTFVTSPKGQKAICSVGTDDGGKGWLNGKQVYSDDGSHGATPGQTKIPVELKAGRNEVWLKVTQGSAGWGFFFDLLDPQNGKPLGDIVYSARP
jgi:hypothetical protein